jgi:hypothetical protein
VAFLLRLMICTGLVIGLSGFTWIEKLFAPKAELWAFWNNENPANTTSLDHTDWTDFLRRYVVVGPDGAGQVSYSKVSSADRNDLAAYVSRLTSTAIRSFSKAEQLAYWINLYNARTVLLILEHYPVDSIRDINLSDGIFNSGPWGEPLMQIEGQDISLNDIEHRILRPVWQDARLHYALNCASVGCPDLQNEAFTMANMSERLESSARQYINHPRGVQVDDNGIVLSKIYAWFADEFAAEPGGLWGHLRRYANRELGATLESEPEILGHEYDWRLNDATAN